MGRRIACRILKCHIILALFFFSVASVFCLAGEGYQPPYPFFDFKISENAPSLYSVIRQDKSKNLVKLAYRWRGTSNLREREKIVELILCLWSNITPPETESSDLSISDKQQILIFFDGELFINSSDEITAKFEIFLKKSLYKFVEYSFKDSLPQILQSFSSSELDYDLFAKEIIPRIMRQYNCCGIVAADNALLSLNAIICHEKVGAYVRESASRWLLENSAEKSDFWYFLKLLLNGTNVISGSDQNDVLTASSSGGIVFGYGGDDVVGGNDGDCFLFGGEGDDVLVAGKGVSFCFGEEGNNKYVFGNGDGFLYIDQFIFSDINTNIISFRKGISVNDLKFNLDDNDLLISKHDSGDRIRIINWVIYLDEQKRNYSISSFEFFDGLVLDSKSILELID